MCRPRLFSQAWRGPASSVVSVDDRLAPSSDKGRWCTPCQSLPAREVRNDLHGRPRFVGVYTASSSSRLESSPAEPGPTSRGASALPPSLDLNADRTPAPAKRNLARSTRVPRSAAVMSIRRNAPAAVFNSTSGAWWSPSARTRLKAASGPGNDSGPCITIMSTEQNCSRALGHGEAPSA